MCVDSDSAPIHRHHITHQDLEPRNIVKSVTGWLRVVDFKLSDRSHWCVLQDCEKLQGFAWEMKGEPLRDVSWHLWLIPATVAAMALIITCLVGQCCAWHEQVLFLFNSLISHTLGSYFAITLLSYLISEIQPIYEKWPKVENYLGIAPEILDILG